MPNVVDQSAKAPESTISVFIMLVHVQNTRKFMKMTKGNDVIWHHL